MPSASPRFAIFLASEAAVSPRREGLLPRQVMRGTLFSRVVEKRRVDWLKKEEQKLNPIAYFHS